MVKDIAGPFTSEQIARDTANAIGANCSVYSRAIKDADGYDTDGRTWWVEQDDTLPSGKLFGYDTAQFMAKQYKPAKTR